MKNKKTNSSAHAVTMESEAAEVREVRVADVLVPERRARRLGDVTSLVESISQGRLIEPIVVRRMVDGGLVLVSGAHRLEAHRQLGRETILARILVLSDLEAELIEIDENLVRIELTALERGEHLLRRKQIYEELHPEVKHGGAPGKSGGGKKTKDATVSSFAEDASAKTGLSIRTVQDDVKIARLSDGAKQAIRGTPLEDRKRVLLQLTRVAPENQAAVAAEIASGRCRSVAQAAADLGVQSARLPRSQRGDIEARVEEVARPLREARRRWERLLGDLDPASASASQSIGEGFATLEQRLAALMGSVKALAVCSSPEEGASEPATREATVGLHDAKHALALRQDGPRADVPAAVAAAVELLKIVTADEAVRLTGLGRDELQEGDALAAPLAEMMAEVARLRSRAGKQNRRSHRRPSTVPNFVMALGTIVPADSSFAREHGSVLRVWEVFESARSYLCKIEPPIESAYNEHVTTRGHDAASDSICTVIERFIEHGRALVRGEYTFVRYLEDQGVAPVLFHKASAAFVQEVTEGLRAYAGLLGDVSTLMPSSATSSTDGAPAIETEVTSPGIPWTITGPLDELAFNEIREGLRECIAAMERGCETLAEIYRDRTLPPDVQGIWDAAIDRALQWGPLLDGTWTHADHLRAWGTDPTMQTRRATQVSQESNRAVPTGAPALPRATETESIPAEAQKEFNAILLRYVCNGTRQQAEQEIREVGWSAEVRDAALRLFWAMAGKEASPAPPAIDHPELQAGVRHHAPEAPVCG